MDGFVTQDVTDPTDFDDPKLSKVDSSLRCPVCKEFFDGPVSLHCGHSFCSQCIRTALRTKPECPCCRIQALESHLRKNLALEESVVSWKAARQIVLSSMRPIAISSEYRPAKKRKLSNGPSSPKRASSFSSAGLEDVPIEVSSSPPVVKDATPGPGDFVTCPVCAKHVVYKKLNDHLDRQCKDAPTARLEAGEGLDSFFKAKSSNVGASASKAKAKPRVPIAKFSYDAMKLTQIKTALAKYDLTQTGGREAMVTRLQHWVEIYNANLDRREDLQHSDGALRAELRRWEDSQSQLLAKGKTEIPDDTKTYENAHKEDFAKLIEKARGSAKKVKAQKSDNPLRAPIRDSSPAADINTKDALDDVICID